jgi:hypothetical protein
MRVHELRFLTAICVIAVAAFAVVRGWEVATAGTAGDVARERYNPADADSVAKRRATLVEQLSQRPASSLHWALLAQTQLQNGEPPERVLRTLTLSAVTGPNEGTVMATRARLGILLWESMPPDLQKRTINDLAGFNLDDAVSPGVALSLKPPAVREEIAAALQKTPGITGARLQKLGFTR